MELMLVFGISIALELLLYRSRFGWRNRKIIAVINLLLTVIAASWLLYISVNVITVLAFSTCVYRVVNLLRLIKGRMHEQYLRRVTARTSRFLIGCMFALLGIGAIWQHIEVGHNQLLFISLIQLVSAVVVIAITIKNLIKIRFTPAMRTLADRELPTVSVAIPARNETIELEACLQSVLASDYPKLEILVLDDCSQDRTAEIIREYAHDGVRFLSGSDPKDNWLAKNQAYDQLAQAASGDFILFCGVDVRFGTKTIRALITDMLVRNKAMVSVMPQRAEKGLHVALIQPMRYWWELALPRKLFNRPPVLSTCWIISNRALKKCGGIEAVSHSIIPEAFFARQLIQDNRYSFMRSTPDLQLNTVKGWRDQFDTALRLRYPEVRRRPEMVLLLTVVELFLLLGPFVLLFVGFSYNLGAAHIIVAVASALLLLTHGLIVSVTNRANTLLSLFNYPLVVLTEIAMGNYSMLKYEFSTVDWKGRNVCLPVMHAYPRLPNLS